MQTFPLYTVIICDLNSLNRNSHLSRLNAKSRVAPLFVRPMRHTTGGKPRVRYAPQRYVQQSVTPKATF